MADLTPTPPPPPPRPSCFQDWSTRINYAVDAAGDLHAHQRAALKAIRSFWTDGRGNDGDGNANLALPCVISLPTGTGKSVIAALAPYVLESVRALIICPDKVTTSQLAKGLGSGSVPETIFVKRGIVDIDLAQTRGFLPDIKTGGAVRSATFTEVELSRSELVVTNAHKFSSTAPGGAAEPNWRTVGVDFFDVVIVDEAHHFPARFWSSAMNHFSQSKVIFLTATPFRHDGQIVLGAGGPAYALSRAEAVARGIIRDVRDEFIDNVVEGKPDAWMETLQRIESLLASKDLNTPLPNGKHHQAMACASSERDARMIVQHATDLGINAEAYVGVLATPATLRKFTSGCTRVLVICRMLLEGFDHPPVSVVAIMNRVVSPVKFSQFVGRAVRIEHNQDGATDEQVAHCIHHKFFEQSVNFNRYTSDELIEAEYLRAEAEFNLAGNEEADEGDALVMEL